MEYDRAVLWAVLSIEGNPGFFRHLESVRNRNIPLQNVTSIQNYDLLTRKVFLRFKF